MHQSVDVFVSGLKRYGTHNAVEAVEGGVEVGLLAQAVHLYHHLSQEYPQEDELSEIYTQRRQSKKRKKSPVNYVYENMHLRFFALTVLFCRKMTQCVLRDHIVCLNVSVFVVGSALLWI